MHRAEHSALYFGKGREDRFDDPEGEYGVMYVAQDEFGAFVETFLRDPKLTLVDGAELGSRRLSVVEAGKDLALVDLTSEGLQHAGVKGDASTAPHEETQPLSRAVHEHPSRPDGIRYRLRQDLGRIGVAIFERALEARDLRELDRGSLLAPRNARLLGDLLENYKKDYI